MNQNAQPGLEDAICLAATAHAGQVYPSVPPQPYILHPLRLVVQASSEEERIVAALHDVVEDTHLTLDDLRRAGYDERIITAVDHLTRREGEPYEEYIARLSADPLARAVKLLDLADNLANSARLPSTPEVLERIARYEWARARILAGEAA
ncbi:MAG: hypothetical protein RMK84_13245 [Oscillochloridaceae bacterium]|nr:hypothetical protein [Chloroflexaceae bacterium]MDW8391085.1 hypothetical protein [Oscillochloridaceae bacterium]